MKWNHKIDAWKDKIEESFPILQSLKGKMHILHVNYSTGYLVLMIWTISYVSRMSYVQGCPDIRVKSIRRRNVSRISNQKVRAFSIN